jgi:hypothetical protein
MKRIINTNHKKIDFKTKYYSHQPGNFKPSGLWYGINNEWVEWCKYNMKDWVKKGIIELTHIDLNKIIIIENIKQLETFSNEFGHIEFDIKKIDWKKVSNKYSGIEIRNYNKIRSIRKFDIYDNIWFLGWDVSSGCIWDLSIIKEFKYYEI